MRNIKSLKEGIKLKIGRIGAILTIIMLNCSNCFATSGIQGTKLVTGTEKLIGDITNWLLILAPVVTIVMVAYYLIRKSASDDMDAKRWDSRVKVAIISCIGVVVMSGLINVLVGYYK